jgi:hypothetical protein
MPAGSAVGGAVLDGAREGESRWKLVLHTELVVTSVKVLDEGVSSADDSR